MRSSNAWSDTFVSLLRTRSSLIPGATRPRRGRIYLSQIDLPASTKSGAFFRNKRRRISVINTLSWCERYTNGGLMLGIRYLKTAPTTHVLHHSGGVLRKEGP